ncbi:SNF2-related protein [Oligosphaera ethanolica]|uniref:Helicase n=1 Tax=Oligosphaera ethanolica TaxID=760260 RepID=A0AAE4AM92_9BACT|nr:SNF2-related protein [Oligosphaera ethanolica]MDQ0288160.1 hypothetical protein [Oligosphaera ethanolica]
MSGKNDAMSRADETPCAANADPQLSLLHWDNQNPPCPNRMGKILSEQLTAAEQMDVLTGYFYFNGIPELYAALKAKNKADKPFTLRILVGMEAQIGAKDFAHALVEVEPPPNQSPEERKKRYKENLLAALSKVPSKDKTNTDAGLYNLFVEMLTHQTLRLQLKQTRVPNHGKLYLFYPQTNQSPASYIIGSSNFSKQGLAERQELNVQVHKDGDHAAELARLFNALWNDGSDDIIEVNPKKGSPEDTSGTTPDGLKRDSPYRRPTPFEGYMALMKHYLGNSALDGDLKKSFLDAIEKARYTSFQYQLKGAAHAIRIIRDHGGVIIADAVGLGKSVTAALIATQAHPGGGIIIVPPTLVDDWETEYLKKFKLDAPGRPWKVFPMTDLVKAAAYCEKNPIGMVIVDEAHRFRNPKIEDYEKLKQLCQNRRVVLLTATPFNNRPADLASLVDLFAARNDKLPEQPQLSIYDYICEQDKKYQELVFLERNWNRLSRPRTVKTSFQTLKAKYEKPIIEEEKVSRPAIKDKKDIRPALEDIGKGLFATLHPYVVRRNRSDLKENPVYFENGGPITMPKQEVHGEYYALAPAQNQAFMAVLSVFQHSADREQATPNQISGAANHAATGTAGAGFACTIYRVAEFVAAEGNEETGNYLDNYRSMTLRHLLRRFESSPYAFQRSVQKLLDRYTQAIKDLQDPEKLYYFPQGLDAGDDTDDDDLPAADLKNLRYCRPGAKIPGIPFLPGQDEVFIAGLQADLKVLRCLQDHAVTLVQKDSKLALLKEKIAPAVKQQPDEPDPLLADEAAGDLPSEGAPRRVVIFTMFIDSARFLAQELAKEFGDNAVMLAIDKQQGDIKDNLDLRKVKLVHATSNVNACFDVKADTKNLWTAPRILVTTDKFSEGVNLNRAGLMVNYDIPWNPVRIIQRLGRFNRINACWFKTIHAYNLYPEYQRADSHGKPAGADWASPQDIAAQKLIMIHQLFFEDATILGDDTAGTGLPFEQIELEAAKGSEPASEETEVQKRYREALDHNGYVNAQDIANLEKDLLAYGLGMKTVRLKAPEANMLRFSQKGALVQAEILEELHPSDANKRMAPIDFIEALDKIAATKTDPCPEPDRFPDDYETIEKRMDTPPDLTMISPGSRTRSRLTQKAENILFEWQRRYSDGNSTALYSACQQGRLSKKQMEDIIDLGNNASIAEINELISQLQPTPAPELLPVTESKAATFHEHDTILTFVNDK